MHVGLIGGIGPAATVFYYTQLVQRHAAAGKKLDLTIVHGDPREVSQNMLARAPERQAQVFAGLIARLKAAGAEYAAVTSMGSHFCVRELELITTLPLINIIPAMADAVRAKGCRRVGIMGTRAVIETKCYGALGGIEVLAPEGDAVMATHQNYTDMAISGAATEQHREFFFREGRDLMRRGAEAVVLGGTDMFLAFEGRDCGFPIIDSAAAHVEAVARVTLGEAGLR